MCENFKYISLFLTVTGTTVPTEWPIGTEPTSAKCVPGWTEWINEEISPRPDEPKQIDVEPIPNTLTMVLNDF